MKVKRILPYLSAAVLVAILLTCLPSAGLAAEAPQEPAVSDTVSSPDTPIAGDTAVPEDPEVPADPEIPEVPERVIPPVNTGPQHQPFMNGLTDGTFEPDRALTRAQLAQLIYAALLDPPAEPTATAPDVPANAWFAKAVSAMLDLGIMEVDADGNFCPDIFATRAICAHAISSLVPDAETEVTFADIPENHWARTAISNVAAAGLFEGDENGNFNPGQYLTRAQAAALFCRLMDRRPDHTDISGRDDLTFFLDLSSGHWAYDYIMEAVTPHDRYDVDGEEHWINAAPKPSTAPDGFYRIGGWLYCLKDGTFLRSTTDGYFTFDAQGRYTTGDDALDQKLNAIVEQYTTSAMTRDQKLRALFDYEVSNYTYLSRPHLAKGSEGWQTNYAKEFLNRGKGNCYSFASTYCFLCRELGLPAYTYIGDAGFTTVSDHCWVEIPLDGTTFIFDPQLARRYVYEGGNNWNFFKFTLDVAPMRYVY